MRVAIIASAHGFGHVGRQLAVVEMLLELGHEVRLYTAAPPELLRIRGERRAGQLEVVPWRVDVGLVQSDSLTHDLEATRGRWAEAVGRIDALADDLRGCDRALVDIAPTGLEACRRAGVPVVAVGNFDWAWIYEHYAPLREFVPQMRAWQAPHPGLALAPGPGLHGFSTVRSVQAPLARRDVAADEGDIAVPGGRPPRFASLGSGRRVLVAFGGLGLDDLESWLPRLPGVTWMVAPPLARVMRDDVAYVEGVPFVRLLAAVDAVLTKPGYGIVAEAMLCGTRLCWVDRGEFPEAPYLEAAMYARGDEKVQGGKAGVAAAITAALAAPSPAAVEGTATVDVVRAILGA